MLLGSNEAPLLALAAKRTMPKLSCWLSDTYCAGNGIAAVPMPLLSPVRAYADHALSNSGWHSAAVAAAEVVAIGVARWRNLHS